MGTSHMPHNDSILEPNKQCLWGFVGGHVSPLSGGIRILREPHKANNESESLGFCTSKCEKSEAFYSDVDRNLSEPQN